MKRKKRGVVDVRKQKQKRKQKKQKIYFHFQGDSLKRKQKLFTVSSGSLFVFVLL